MEDYENCICKECGLPIYDDQDPLKCDYCKYYQHLACAKNASSIHDKLNIFKNWKCTGCVTLETVAKNIFNDSKLSIVSVISNDNSYIEIENELQSKLSSCKYAEKLVNVPLADEFDSVIKVGSLLCKNKLVQQVFQDFSSLENVVEEPSGLPSFTKKNNLDEPPMEMANCFIYTPANISGDIFQMKSEFKSNETLPFNNKKEKFDNLAIQNNSNASIITEFSKKSDKNLEIYESKPSITEAANVLLVREISEHPLVTINSKFGNLSMKTKDSLIDSTGNYSKTIPNFENSTTIAKHFGPFRCISENNNNDPIIETENGFLYDLDLVTDNYQLESKVLDPSECIPLNLVTEKKNVNNCILDKVNKYTLSLSNIFERKSIVLDKLRKFLNSKSLVTNENNENSLMLKNISENYTNIGLNPVVKKSLTKCIGNTGAENESDCEVKSENSLENFAVENCISEPCQFKPIQHDYLNSNNPDIESDNNFSLILSASEDENTDNDKEDIMVSSTKVAKKNYKIKNAADVLCDPNGKNNNSNIVLFAKATDASNIENDSEVSYDTNLILDNENVSTKVKNKIYQTQNEAELPEHSSQLKDNENIILTLKVPEVSEIVAEAEIPYGNNEAKDYDNIISLTKVPEEISSFCNESEVPCDSERTIVMENIFSLPKVPENILQRENKDIKIHDNSLPENILLRENEVKISSHLLTENKDIKIHDNSLVYESSKNIYVPKNELAKSCGKQLQATEDANLTMQDKTLCTNTLNNASQSNCLENKKIEEKCKLSTCVLPQVKENLGCKETGLITKIEKFTDSTDKLFGFIENKKKILLEDLKHVIGENLTFKKKRKCSDSFIEIEGSNKKAGGGLKSRKSSSSNHSNRISDLSSEPKMDSMILHKAGSSDMSILAEGTQLLDFNETSRPTGKNVEYIMLLKGTKNRRPKLFDSNGFQYTRFPSSNSNLIIWRCHRRTCKVAIHQVNNNYAMKYEHCHEGDPNCYLTAINLKKNECVKENKLQICKKVNIKLPKLQIGLSMTKKQCITRSHSKSEVPNDSERTVVIFSLPKVPENILQRENEVKLSSHLLTENKDIQICEMSKNELAKSCGEQLQATEDANLTMQDKNLHVNKQNNTSQNNCLENDKIEEKCKLPTCVLPQVKENLDDYMEAGVITKVEKITDSTDKLFGFVENKNKFLLEDLKHVIGENLTYKKKRKCSDSFIELEGSNKKAGIGLKSRKSSSSNHSNRISDLGSEPHMDNMILHKAASSNKSILAEGTKLLDFNETSSPIGKNVEYIMLLKGTESRRPKLFDSNGFQYTRFPCSNSNLIKWHCHRQTCKVTIHQVNNNYSMKYEHCHKGDPNCYLTAIYLKKNECVKENKLQICKNVNIKLPKLQIGPSMTKKQCIKRSHLKELDHSKKNRNTNKKFALKKFWLESNGKSHTMPTNIDKLKACAEVNHGLAQSISDKTSLLTDILYNKNGSKDNIPQLNKNGSKDTSQLLNTSRYPNVLSVHGENEEAMPLTIEYPPMGLFDLGQIDNDLTNDTPSKVYDTCRKRKSGNSSTNLEVELKETKTDVEFVRKLRSRSCDDIRQKVVASCKNNIKDLKIDLKCNLFVKDSPIASSFNVLKTPVSQENLLKDFNIAQCNVSINKLEIDPPKKIIKYIRLPERSPIGKPKLIDSLGYQYRMHTKQLNNIIWHCVKRSSKSACQTTIQQAKNSFKRNKAHCHGGNPDSFINAKTLRRSSNQNDELSKKNIKTSSVFPRLSNNNNEHIRPNGKIFKKVSFILLKTNNNNEQIKLIEKETGYCYKLAKVIGETKVWVCSSETAKSICKAYVKQVGKSFQPSNFQHHHAKNYVSSLTSGISNSTSKCAKRKKKINIQSTEAKKYSEDSVEQFLGNLNEIPTCPKRNSCYRERNISLLPLKVKNSFDIKEFDNAVLSIDDEISLSKLFVIINNVGLSHEKNLDLYIEATASYFNREPLIDFPPNFAPSKEWVCKFIRRHPVLSSMKSERAKSFELANGSQSFYNNFQKAFKDSFNLDATNYMCLENADTIFCVDVFDFIINISKLVVTLEMKSMGRLEGSQRTMSVICCINSLGYSIKPLIINKGDQVSDYDYYDEVDMKYNKSKSSSGYLTNEVFYDWLISFDHELSRLNIKRPAILHLNGNFPFISYRSIEFAKCKKIFMFSSPPHLSNYVHPLRHSVFREINRNYLKRFEAYLEFNSTDNLQRSQFPLVFMKSYEDTDLSTIAKVAFAECHLCPFNLGAADKIVSKVNKTFPGSSNCTGIAFENATVDSFIKSINTIESKGINEVCDQSLIEQGTKKSEASKTLYNTNCQVNCMDNTNIPANKKIIVKDKFKNQNELKINDKWNMKKIKTENRPKSIVKNKHSCLLDKNKNVVKNSKIRKANGKDLEESMPISDSFRILGSISENKHKDELTNLPINKIVDILSTNTPKIDNISNHTTNQRSCKKVFNVPAIEKVNFKIKSHHQINKKVKHKDNFGKNKNIRNKTKHRTLDKKIKVAKKKLKVSKEKSSVISGSISKDEIKFDSNSAATGKKIIRFKRRTLPAILSKSPVTIASNLTHSELCNDDNLSKTSLKVLVEPEKNYLPEQIIFKSEFVKEETSKPEFKSNNSISGRRRSLRLNDVKVENFEMINKHAKTKFEPHTFNKVPYSSCLSTVIPDEIAVSLISSKITSIDVDPKKSPKLSKARGEPDISNFSPKEKTRVVVSKALEIKVNNSEAALLSLPSVNPGRNNCISNIATNNISFTPNLTENKNDLSVSLECSNNKISSTIKRRSIRLKQKCSTDSAKIYNPAHHKMVDFSEGDKTKGNICYNTNFDCNVLNGATLLNPLSSDVKNLTINISAEQTSLLEKETESLINNNNSKDTSNSFLDSVIVSSNENNFVIESNSEVPSNKLDNSQILVSTLEDQTCTTTAADKCINLYKLALHDLEKEFENIIDPFVLEGYKQNYECDVTCPDTSYLLWRSLQQLKSNSSKFNQDF